LAERDVYVCGPPAMADITLRNVRACGVPRRQIHVDRFAL
jgi:ferredoxin-NADP reductase